MEFYIYTELNPFKNLQLIPQKMKLYFTMDVINEIFIYEQAYWFTSGFWRTFEKQIRKKFNALLFILGKECLSHVL